MREVKYFLSKKVWLVLCCIFLVMLFVKYSSNGFIFGYRTSFVITGSMEPEIPIASLLIEKEYNGSDPLQIGDVITFLITDEQKIVRVTHRIIGIDGNHFLTKGDANSDIDKWSVTQNDVEAMVNFVYPYFLQTVSILLLLTINLLYLRKRRDLYS